MPVYKVEFTAKGYLEINASNKEEAFEKAADLVHGMSPKTFSETFADEVEANHVECTEEDVNPHDYYLDIG